MMAATATQKSFRNNGKYQLALENSLVMLGNYKLALRKVILST
jgi:hypothetical protein